MIRIGFMVQAQESWRIIVHLAHDALFERPHLCSGVKRCQPCGVERGGLQPTLHSVNP